MQHMRECRNSGSYASRFWPNAEGEINPRRFAREARFLYLSQRKLITKITFAYVIYKKIDTVETLCFGAKVMQRESKRRVILC